MMTVMATNKEKESPPKRDYHRMADTAFLAVATVYDALLIGSSGLHKLVPFSRFGSAFWNQWFTQWGYPHWFLVVVAFVELCGTVLLSIPRTASYAAYGLMVVMAGAIVTTTVHAHDTLAPGLRASDMRPLPPSVALAFLVLIVLLRRRR